MNLISYGAVMGACVEGVDQNSRKVTVVAKRRMSTNAGTTLTETTFHKRFGQTVDIIRRGERLASKPPK